MHTYTLYLIAALNQLCIAKLPAFNAQFPESIGTKEYVLGNGFTIKMVGECEDNNLDGDVWERWLYREVVTGELHRNGECIASEVIYAYC